MNNPSRHSFISSPSLNLPYILGTALNFVKPDPEPYEENDEKT